MGKQQSTTNNKQVFVLAGVGLAVAVGAYFYFSAPSANDATSQPIVSSEAEQGQAVSQTPVHNTPVRPPMGTSTPRQAEPVAQQAAPDRTTEEAAADSAGQAKTSPAPAPAANDAVAAFLMNNEPASETAATGTEGTEGRLLVTPDEAPAEKSPSAASQMVSSMFGQVVSSVTSLLSADGVADGVAPPATQEVPGELKLTDLIERVEPAVVRINTRSPAGYSVGSGYVVADDGTIVTNYHVIEGAKEATVEFADGTKCNVLGFKHYDTAYDIAVIQIEVPEKGLTVLPLADELPRKGESVVAFGAPHGLSFTATEGIISAIRPEEEFKDQLNLDMKGTWLQTSTPISPGNSGGPLVDLQGRVVAINTMQLSVGQNLNFAVSALDVQEMLKAAENKPVEEFSPEKLQEMDRGLKRQLAKDLEGTPRGNELLAKVDEIWLLLLYKDSNIDPSAKTQETVYLHAEQAIKKSGVNLSFGEPSGDAAVMIVTVDLKMVRDASLGTQKLMVDAFLICEDPEQKSNNKFVKIWTAQETDMGTVALQAISRGQLPRNISTELTRFFNKFRAAKNKAARAVAGS